MIHQYQNNGYSIVLDVNSGAVHVVDELCYAAIAQLAAGEEPDLAALEKPETLEKLQAALGDRYESGQIREAWEDIKELTREGRLFTRDVFEPMIDQVKQRKTVVKALCLHIAHDCNLACKYCFAEEGEYHGRRALMSYEVGKKALDFLIASSGNRRNLEVDFFGGEPLMNWQVVKDLVAYGRQQEKLHDKHFRFTVTTNGVLLNDEIQEFINQEMDNVVLSLDGRREVNDAMRPFRNGKGSYDLIVPKFQKLADSRNQERYYVRGTFTRNNLDFSNDVLHFADLGFKQMSIEPVVGDESDPYAIREEDIPKICEEYDRLAKLMIEREREGEGFNRPGGRTLRVQAAVWLRLRNGVPGRDALGGPLSLSSVCRPGGVPHGERGRGHHAPGDRGRVSGMQRVLKGEVQELLCQILLQRRMHGQRLQFPRHHPRGLRHRM